MEPEPVEKGRMDVAVRKSLTRRCVQLNVGVFFQGFVLIFFLPLNSNLQISSWTNPDLEEKKSDPYPTTHNKGKNITMQGGLKNISTYMIEE